MKRIITIFILLLVFCVGVSSITRAQSVNGQIYQPQQQDQQTTQCLVLTRNLHYGSRDINGEVSQLQSFLISRGYLAISGPTGFFGLRTYAAVRKLQSDNGVVSTGGVGPLTRGLIQKISCQLVSGQVSITTLNPLSGTIGTQVMITGSGFTSTGNIIHFGAGGVRSVYSINGGNQLTFTIPGVISGCDVSALGSLCPQYMQQVTPGSYPIYVSNAFGRSNTINFTVTTSTTSGTGRTPIITSISGPNSLQIGQSGTWTVETVADLNAQLTYSVRWGDESAGVQPLGAVASSQIQQTSTFGHTYTAVGVYNPIFTVRDSNGNEVQTSISVQVNNVSSASPTITSLNPSYGQIGTSVTIQGTGFTPTGDTINFGAGGVIPNVSASGGAYITFTVPTYLNPACYYATPRCLLPSQQVQPGVYPVSVTNGNGVMTNSVNFTVVVY